MTPLFRPDTRVGHIVQNNSIYGEVLALWVVFLLIPSPHDALARLHGEGKVRLYSLSTSVCCSSYTGTHHQPPLARLNPGQVADISHQSSNSCCSCRVCFSH